MGRGGQLPPCSPLVTSLLEFKFAWLHRPVDWKPAGRAGLCDGKFLLSFSHPKIQSTVLFIFQRHPCENWHV